MARTSTFTLHDRAIGGGLVDLLTGWRAEGMSLEDIAYRLRSEHDLTVSAATVHRWCTELGIEKSNDEPTPSDPSTEGARS